MPISEIPVRVTEILLLLAKVLLASVPRDVKSVLVLVINNKLTKM